VLTIPVVIAAKGIYRFYEGADFKRGVKTGFITTSNPQLP
jgi:hypothetical protein